MGWIEQQSRWSELHAIGNSRIVRSSALVPLIGYLILLNANLAQYARIYGDFDVSWRLIALYLGLSLVGLASIIYAAFCPETIKRYRTAVEYTIAENSYFLAGNNFRYVCDSARADYHKLAEWKKSVPGLTDPDLLADELPRAEHIYVLMTARWTIRNLSRRLWRTTALAFYAIGFGIVSIPTLATAVNVLMVIVRAAYNV